MKSISKYNAAIYRNGQSIINYKLKDLDIKSGQHDFFYIISKNYLKTNLMFYIFKTLIQNDKYKIYQLFEFLLLEILIKINKMCIFDS